MKTKTPCSQLLFTIASMPYPYTREEKLDILEAALAIASESQWDHAEKSAARYIKKGNALPMAEYAFPILCDCFAEGRSITQEEWENISQAIYPTSYAG